MIADSAIIGFCTQRVIFDTTYLRLEPSYVSTWNEVQYIAKACRYNKNQEKPFGTTLVPRVTCISWSGGVW